MLNRRRLLIALGAAASTPGVVLAQAKQKPALILMNSAVFSPEFEAIGKFALAQRWPVVYATANVALGGLLSYGGDFAASFRRAAYYVDRSLRGAKSSDLPIEQSATFELVVNLKTARALDITVPQSVLIQATRIIE